MIETPVHIRAKHPTLRRAGAILLLALCANLNAQTTPTAAEEPVAVLAQKEYFIPQNAGEAIAVRVSAFEAEFASMLSTEDGDTQQVSALDGGRMLPIFQFVPDPASSRQVDINLAATQVTDRTEFELEVIRIYVRDERSATLARAYRMLAQGLEVLQNGNAPMWTVKVQTLVTAAGLFDEQGRQEMKLWCQLYATHLILTQMRDGQTALDRASDLLQTPRIDRYPLIEFGAYKIISGATAMTTSSADATDVTQSPLQLALADTASAAAKNGYEYERALALREAGADLKQNGAASAALEKLNQALEIAESIGAGDLAASVRELMVGIHQDAGDADASGSVLQDIESHLVETGEDEELARNLLSQGQLHLQEHRYLQALDVLTRASGLEQSGRTRLEMELALGAALNGAGRVGEALPHFTRAVTDPVSGRFRPPNALFDVGAILGEMAAIYRQSGDFQPMTELRSAQRPYLHSASQRGQWAFEYARDATAQWGNGSAATLDRYRQALDVSAGGNWQNLSRLGLCAQEAARGRGGAPCQAQALESAFSAINNSGTDVQRAEAAIHWSAYLAASGNAQRGFAVADASLDQVLAVGARALGAWYWQRRDALFENYINLAIHTESGSDATSSLSALAKARLVERGDPALRNAAALGEFLASLPSDSAVVSYYLGGQSAQAWLADADDVRRVAIGDAASIRALCTQMRAAIAARNWAEYDRLARRLGDALLSPLEGQIPQTVLLANHGPLLGIPVDALSLRDQPLAASHQVVNLDLLPGSAASPRGTDSGGQVFLAGDPSDWSGDYQANLASSPEVTAVKDRFVGPGLHTIQGIALLSDEFNNNFYADASLVHLSVPANIELFPGGRSSLFLSEAAKGEGRQTLDAQALSAMPLNAGLVFLSRTEFVGEDSVLANKAGVASAVLEAGASAAIASLWPVADESRARLVADFYDHLKQAGNSTTALALAKRDSMRAGLDRDWASFQLFLN